MGFNRVALLTPLAASLLALGGAAADAHAQQLEELRRQYLIEIPPVLAPILQDRARTSPGSSSGSPSAFGAGWGDFFVGGGLQSRTRHDTDPTWRDPDGTAVFGFGLGDARRLVGLEVAFTSVSTLDSGLFERTAVSFKAHRIVGENWGVGVGYENALTFGEGLDGGNSLFGVVSRVWDLSGVGPFIASTTSIGIGNGRFRFEDDVSDGRETVNLFASVGVQVLEPLALIADWTGQDLTLAASIVPFRSLPLVITPGLADVTGAAGDGARFILGAGMGLNVRQVRGALSR